MPRPRTIDDAQILAAARRVIREQGVAASTREIARAAGISEAVLFQRYGTKLGLIQAALALPAVTIAAPSAQDPRAALEELALAVLASFRKVLPRLLPMLGSPELQVEQLLRDEASPFRRILAAVDRHLTSERDARRIRVKSPHEAAFFLVSALHTAALFEAIEGRRIVKDQVVRSIVGTLWEGLKP